MRGGKDGGHGASSRCQWSWQKLLRMAGFKLPRTSLYDTETTLGPLGLLREPSATASARGTRCLQGVVVNTRTRGQADVQSQARPHKIDLDSSWWWTQDSNQITCEAIVSQETCVLRSSCLKPLAAGYKCTTSSIPQCTRLAEYDSRQGR